MTLSGLAASSVATASENQTVRVSATFPLGSSVLTKAQKAAIKKAVNTSGKDATFLVTATAGRLPGVSDSRVKLLAKKRGQAIKVHLVKLGVNKSSVSTKVKITRFGIVPKTKLVGTYAAPVLTTDSAAETTNAPAAPTIALTCAAGGTCVVGDRGPGGGIVYYVSATNFTSTGSICNTACKYLEVAPATWQSAGASVENDLAYQWSTSLNDLTGQDITTASTEGIVAKVDSEKANWKIGQGFNNTKIMKVVDAASDAQTKVLAYAGNSTAGQWFIPSMNELNELCKYARGQTTGDPTVACSNSGTLKSGIANDLGGFVSSVYWSSSEDNLENAGLQFFADDFDGYQGGNLKDDTGYVRPVRAF
jgi:hypothetical protein